MVLRAEQVCTYDLDDVDQSWLGGFNGERALMGLGAVTGTYRPNDKEISVYPLVGPSFIERDSLTRFFCSGFFPQSAHSGPIRDVLGPF